jgi:hypothetical protein
MKVSLPKPSSQKNVKETKTKFETSLTSYDFDFIIAALKDAFLEISEKQEAKQEELFSRIKDELQGVQQTLKSSSIVSTVPLSEGKRKLGDEPAQLHFIVDIVEASLRQAQEETTQATQDLSQVHKYLEEQQSAAQWENISLQVKWDEEKTQLQQSKE